MNDDGTVSVTPIMNPTLHLMCFRVKGGQAPNAQVNTNNQFSRERLLVGKQQELCLPSNKSLKPDPPPPPPPSTTLFGAPANGINDNFAPPTEPASPSAGLLGFFAFLGVGAVDFDPIPTDQFFGHTITGLPPCITGATLEIHMRAGPSFLTNTDSLALEFQGITATPRFEWALRVNDLIDFATAGGQTVWTPGSDFTFILDLDNLPPDGQGDTSVIDSMNTTGTLDVMVQDDTGVDYMVLTVTSNCDHYLGYKIKPVEETQTVFLVDQFIKGDFQIGEPDRLYTPADKQLPPAIADTTNIHDPATHLKRYRITGPGVKVKNIRVKNQFGTFFIDVKGPDRLLVPTTKALLGAKLPDPPGDDVNVDHFLCYKTEVDFQAGVTVADQFGLFDYKVSNAIRFCNPVEKRVFQPDGTVAITPIKNPETHLMCFEVQGGIPPDATVNTNNQFGRERLIVREANELCVPSRKKLPPLDIPAGFDLFRTVEGSAFALGGIPGGFFGDMGDAPSDPIRVPITVEMNGVSIGKSFGLPPGPLAIPKTCWEKVGPNFKRHCAITNVTPPETKDTSTIVKRKEDIVLNNIGDSGTIEIELVALSLRSVEPIEVTYGGGGATQFFDVFVELDPNQGRVDDLDTIRRTGSMTLTRTSVDGGTFDSALPLAFRLTFTNTDPNGPSAAGPIVDADVLTANNASFTVVRSRSDDDLRRRKR